MYFSINWNFHPLAVDLYDNSVETIEKWACWWGIVVLGHNDDKGIYTLNLYFLVYFYMCKTIPIVCLQNVPEAVRKLEAELS